MQQPLFEPEVPGWSPPSMSDLPSWEEARRVGVDIETRDMGLANDVGPGTYRSDSYIVGVSFTIEDHRSYYLPFRHAGGDNLDEEQVLAYLRDNARVFSGAYVGANLSYDLGFLWEEGVESPEARYLDIQIADPLIYELHRSYSLQSIAERYGLPGKDEEALREAARAYKVDPKSDMWKLPARYVGRYAEEDSHQPLMIMRRQERLIEEHDLWGIWNLECEVLPALVRMQRRGVLIDQDKLGEIEEWSAEQEREALEKIHHATGVRVKLGDVWKPEVLAPALEHIGVDLPRTSTGAPSIDKALLSGLKHPVADAMLWARKTNKLRTTFASSVRRHLINGRIHCNFRQIAAEDKRGEQKGARFGRLSATNPNMQQQPSRDEFAKMWRSIYLPEEGMLWACNDYSQQEPRWTTHFAAKLDLPQAREAAQAYCDDPNLDNHDFMTTLVHGITREDVEHELFEKKRKPCKDIYLGLCYGEGGAKLCRDLGLDTRWALSFKANGQRRMEYYETREQAIRARDQRQDGFVFEAAGEEGQDILDQFDDRAPFIRELARRASKTAGARGYIITAGGRHLHFPRRDNGSYDWTHKALNRLIQGTSADQTKRALVELDRAGHYVQLQVHDELDGSVESREVAEEQATIMREVMPALVPFRVDVEIGPNWGEVE